MVKINLSRPVRLHLDVEQSKAVEQAHGLTGVLDLPAGIQEVDEVIAEHWFVKAHFEPLPEDAPQSQGTEGEGDQDSAQNSEQTAAPEKATKKASK